MIRNPVMAAACLVGLVGLLPAFLAQAPNRLMSGTPIALGLSPALLPGAVLLAACVWRRRPVVEAACALILLAGILFVAGHRATALAAHAPAAARTSLGAGAWLLMLAACLAYADAVRGRTAAMLALPLAVALLAMSGALDSLSLMREYASHRAALSEALQQHILLVIGTLIPTALIGLPLGLLAHRRAWWRAKIFAVLNVLQTIPSVALFGLLIAPIGTGAVPAIIALTLYCLLPLVRNTVAGLDGVPAPVLDAARGMGMTRATILARVEIPLAAPAILSGLRVTTVQAVGLAVIAALIGAGGLGAILFEGLSADALDLTLLGVLPTVLLALIADAGLAYAARHA